MLDRQDTCPKSVAKCKWLVMLPAKCGPWEGLQSKHVRVASKCRLVEGSQDETDRIGRRSSYNTHAGDVLSENHKDPAMMHTVCPHHW